MEPRPTNDDVLGQLERAPDDPERDAIILRNLTRFDYRFDAWLAEKVLSPADVDPDLQDRRAELRHRINALVETGDYAGARFDEEHPSNPKEVLIALARRVERGELTLEQAEVEGRAWILADEGAVPAEDWRELARSLARVADPLPFHLRLAELMEELGGAVPGVDRVLAYGPLANLLSRRAMALRRQGEFREALRVYERLSALALEHDDMRNACTSLMGAGDVCQVHLDDLARAERYYEAALGRCHADALGPGIESDILIELGNVLMRQSRLGEAIDRLTRCVELRRALGPAHRVQLGNALVRLAVARRERGDDAEAAACYEASLDLAPDVEERLSRAMDLGLVLAGLDGRRAEAVFADAVDRLAGLEGPDGPPHELRHRLYGMLGTVRMRTNNWQGAADALHAAVEAARAVGDDRSEARWLANLTQCQMLLGLQSAVEQNLQTAVEIHRRHEDYSAAANAAMTLGHWSYAHGRESRNRERVLLAGRVWAEAFAYFHLAGQSAQMGLAVLVLNRVHRALGDAARAGRCLEYGLDRARAAGETRFELYAHREWAELHAEQGRWQEAEAELARAIALAGQVGETTSEGELLVLHGRALERPGRPGEAEGQYRRALAVQNAARGGLRSVEARMGVQGRPTGAHAPLIGLLSRQPGRPGARAEALALSEQARSRTLAELLSRRRVRAPDSMPRELLEREARLLGSLLRIEESAAAGTEPAREHRRLNDELEALWSDMAAVDGPCQDYVGLRGGAGIDAGEVARLLEP